MPGKPDDIPQDVWDAGEDHLRRYSYLLSSTEIVARAILAERERCAKIAGGYVPLQIRAISADADRVTPKVAADIAAAIRKGGA